MNFARALAGAALVLLLAGCVRLDLQATLTDHDTADGTLVIALADDAVPVPSAEATPTAEAHPAEGIISDWGAPITLATFLVGVIGGLIAYMVSRRQRARHDRAHT